MTSEEIKAECERMYIQINDADNRLVELRAICSHANTIERNYSWRIGACEPAIICNDCGKVLKTASIKHSI